MRGMPDIVYPAPSVRWDRAAVERHPSLEDCFMPNGLGLELPVYLSSKNKLSKEPDDADDTDAASTSSSPSNVLSASSGPSSSTTAASSCNGHSASNNSNIASHSGPGLSNGNGAGGAGASNPRRQRHDLLLQASRITENSQAEREQEHEDQEEDEDMFLVLSFNRAVNIKAKPCDDGIARFCVAAYYMNELSEHSKKSSTVTVELNEDNKYKVTVPLDMGQLKVPFDSKQQFLKVALFQELPGVHSRIGEATVPIADDDCRNMSFWHLLHDFQEQGEISLSVSEPTARSRLPVHLKEEGASSPGKNALLLLGSECTRPPALRKGWLSSGFGLNGEGEEDEELGGGGGAGAVGGEGGLGLVTLPSPPRLTVPEEEDPWGLFYQPHLEEKRGLSFDSALCPDIDCGSIAPGPGFRYGPDARTDPLEEMMNLMSNPLKCCAVEEQVQSNMVVAIQAKSYDWRSGVEWVATHGAVYGQDICQKLFNVAIASGHEVSVGITYLWNSWASSTDDKDEGSTKPSLHRTRRPSLQVPVNTAVCVQAGQPASTDDDSPFSFVPAPLSPRSPVALPASNAQRAARQPASDAERQQMLQRMLQQQQQQKPRQQQPLQQKPVIGLTPPNLQPFLPQPYNAPTATLFSTPAATHQAPQFHHHHHHHLPHVPSHVHQQQFSYSTPQSQPQPVGTQHSMQQPSSPPRAMQMMPPAQQQQQQQSYRTSFKPNKWIKSFPFGGNREARTYNYNVSGLKTVDSYHHSTTPSATAVKPSTTTTTTYISGPPAPATTGIARMTTTTTTTYHTVGSFHQPTNSGYHHSYVPQYVRH